MRLRKLDLPPEVSDDTIRAFLRLYQLETWTREMVYLELKSYYGMEWWNEAEAALKRARMPVGLTSKYLAKDKQHPHISTRENDPLWFISLDSLLKIIFDAKLWKLFRSYFTTKRLLRMRFEEIMPTRNRVAHCRALHAYDVDRLEQLMRDFDQGFWRFCTSYRDRYRFRNKLSKNHVYNYVADREDGNIDLYLSVRPYVAGRKIESHMGPGFVYDVVINTRHLSRYFNYEDILKHTRSVHQFALHIMMDQSQHSLRVTFPGTLDPEVITSAIERYEDVAHNNYSVFPLVCRSGTNRKEEEDSQANWREYEEGNKPFERIASLWPHYVIPPSHPYTFLDGGCPCTFFGVAASLVVSD